MANDKADDTQDGQQYITQHKSEPGSVKSEPIKESQQITDESLYRKLLTVSKKGDKEALLNTLGQIFQLPQGNLNYKDDKGYTA